MSAADYSSTVFLFFFVLLLADSPLDALRWLRAYAAVVVVVVAGDGGGRGSGSSSGSGSGSSSGSQSRCFRVVSFAFGLEVALFDSKLKLTAAARRHRCW